MENLSLGTEADEPARDTPMRHTKPETGNKRRNYETSKNLESSRIGKSVGEFLSDNNLCEQTFSSAHPIEALQKSLCRGVFVTRSEVNFETDSALESDSICSESSYNLLML